MSEFRFEPNSGTTTGWVGKLFSSFFFLIFLGAGLFFFAFIVREVARDFQTWRWQQTECEIIASSVQPNDKGEFTLSLEYRYRFGNTNLTASSYERKPRAFSDYGKVARLAEKYRPGSHALCYVNPGVPSEAVLARPNLLRGLIVLFPLIFVGIGAGGLYFTWRRKPKSSTTPQAISDRANASQNGRKFLAAFFLIFFLAGSGMFYGIFVRPCLRILHARSWLATPCEILSSEVKSHNSDDGTTYRVNILYRYEVNGRSFQANRYHFMGGSSSGYEGKQQIVNRYAPGTQQLCYVNPHDPTDAVLERGFTPDLLFGLIPLVFLFVGAIGLVFVVRKRSAFGLDRQNPDRTGPDSLSVPSGGVVLKPKVSPIAKLAGIIAVALFWNGIVSIFVFQAARSWRSGSPDWFLTLFLIPFVLIGAGLIFGIFYSFLAVFNPRPQLTITPAAVPLGGTLRVEWVFSGRTVILRRLQVRLEGREEATYRRGTTTSTDKSVFARIEMAETTAGPEIRSSSAIVDIPANLMHSFESSNNKIVWSVHVHGAIDRWPDVREEFPITVLPWISRTS